MDLAVIQPRNEIALVEPIYRRQPLETDREFQLFLIYRDLTWDERSLKQVSRAATENENLRFPHTSVVEANKKWQWQKRADAFELFIQEVQSDKQERAVIELKSEVEMIALRLVRKIGSIESIKDPSELSKPEIQRDLAVIEALIGKGNAGRFLLDAYKTVVGEKLQIYSKKTEVLQWRLTGARAT